MSSMVDSLDDCFDVDFVPNHPEIDLDSEICTKHDVVSAPGGKNQVNFDMNSSNHSVEEYDLMGTDDTALNSVKEPSFGLIVQNYDQGVSELGLELRLGFASQEYDNDNDNDADDMDVDCNLIGTGEIASKTVNYSISGEFVDNHDVGCRNLDLGLGLTDRGRNNRVNGIDDYNCGDDLYAARYCNGRSSGAVFIDSNSDEEIENRMEVEGSQGADDDLLGMNVQSDEGGDITVDNVDGDGDYSVSPYWDSFHLREEDREDVNHGLGRGEVDCLGLDEEETIRFTAELEYEEDSILAGIASGSEEDGEIVSRASDLEWSVFMNSIHRYLEYESQYLGELDDFNMDEYEVVLEQFAGGENPNLGCPPTAEATIENLPSVVITHQHVVDENIICAVCMDKINIGEVGSHLPCSHLYHRDCIIPWLRIRNTCPICRFELPTNDPVY